MIKSLNVDVVGHSWDHHEAYLRGICVETTSMIIENGPTPRIFNKQEPLTETMLKFMCASGAFTGRRY